MVLTVVMGFHFLTDFLLLLAASRLCGYPPNRLRSLAAAAIGGVYAGACLVPEFPFAGNRWWLGAVLVTMVLLAFGKNGIRRGAVFLLLKLAMIGVASILDRTLVLALGALMILCFLADHFQADEILPVELTYGRKTVKLTALRDTGNSLTDPVTGSSVLVVGPEIARNLTGLSQQQLKNPVDAMTALPGLRLIPYHTVGTEGGLLLAVRMPRVKVGSWQGSMVVAFAPMGLCGDNRYQALAGGTMR